MVISAYVVYEAIAAGWGGHYNWRKLSVRNDFMIAFDNLIRYKNNSEQRTLSFEF